MAVVTGQIAAEPAENDRQIAGRKKRWITTTFDDSLPDMTSLKTRVWLVPSVRSRIPIRLFGPNAPSPVWPVMGLNTNQVPKLAA